MSIILYLNKKKIPITRDNIIKWSRMSDLNQRPTDYDSVALPTELIRRSPLIINHIFYKAKTIFCQFENNAPLKDNNMQYN